MAAQSTPGSSRPRFGRSLLLLSILIVAGCSSAQPTSQFTYPPVTAGPPASAPPSVAPSPSPAPSFPVTLTDDEGTEVTIPAEPQKIVSLTPATTEILFTIGAGDRVVGKVEDVANFPPEAADIPIVARFDGVDIEQVVALEPDLVISAGVGLTQGDAVEQLRGAEIPVLVIYPTTIDGGLAGIRLIGQATGFADTADSLAIGMEQRIDELERLAATATDKPRVFYEIDVTGGIFTPPADSIYGEMFVLAGAEPISGDASYSISLEELVAADPEVILLGDAAYGVTAESVADRPGWKGMTAVKDGAISPIDDILVTRPGPRLVEGLEALIRAIHPELADQLPVPMPSASLGSSVPETDKPTTGLGGLPIAA
jgi:iron complex transport system substrate-binding protein